MVKTLFLREEGINEYIPWIKSPLAASFSLPCSPIHSFARRPIERMNIFCLLLVSGWISPSLSPSKKWWKTEIWFFLSFSSTLLQQLACSPICWLYLPDQQLCPQKQVKLKLHHQVNKNIVRVLVSQSVSQSVILILLIILGKGAKECLWSLPRGQADRKGRRERSRDKKQNSVGKLTGAWHPCAPEAR